MQLVRPETPEAVAAALGNGSVALAGGTDLVPLVREGLVRAETLVEIDAVVPRGVTSTAATVTIGAGTTLAELETCDDVPQALREACAQAASPQLRAMGTLGGNLLQATRCWYWRLQFPCYLHGGDRCHARDGAHREHAIFGNERCASAHPSDLAAALLALGTTVRTTKRELPLRALFRLPTDDDRSVTTLAPDELILRLDIESADASTYLKAMDRRKWAFALVGVAAVRRGATVSTALAGVAPIPWLLPGLEALDEATPLPGTAYKVELARALVRRALAAVESPAAH